MFEGAVDGSAARPRGARTLTADELRAACDPTALPFASMVELTPLDGLIGQERAQSATTFGIAMWHPGYNLFVLGPARTGKTSAMRQCARADGGRRAGPGGLLLRVQLRRSRPADVDRAPGWPRLEAGAPRRGVQDPRAACVRDRGVRAAARTHPGGFRRAAARASGTAGSPRALRRLRGGPGCGGVRDRARTKG